MIIRRPRKPQKLDYVPEEGCSNWVGLARGIVFPFIRLHSPLLGDDGVPSTYWCCSRNQFPAGYRFGSPRGVIEAEQTKSVRSRENDRLIAVADKSPEHESIGSVKDVDDYLIQIERFLFYTTDCQTSSSRFLNRGPSRASWWKRSQTVPVNTRPLRLPSANGHPSKGRANGSGWLSPTFKKANKAKP